MRIHLRALGALLFAAGLLLAQDRGTIRGTVSDPTGAAVPDSTVTARNVNTGLTQTGKTGVDGIYTILYLPVGAYAVVVERTGFRKAEAANVVVNVNTVVNLDMQLVVGSVDQTVEVSSVAPLLETTGTNLGRIIAAEVIQDLPLTTGGGLRSTTAFIMLTPGVLGGAGNPRISGGLLAGQSYRLDGAESQSERRNDPSFNAVSVEALQEFKVQSGTFSAEFGRTSNAVVNFVTKSGTNDLHGSGFLFNRNEFFNARGYTFTPTTRPVTRQWNPGGSIGGPVYIPRVFDGRNKAFFFFTYERSHSVAGRPTNLITVPIPEFRRGDMRKYVDSSGRTIPIYDPFDASGNFVQDPLARKQVECNGVLNVICPARLDPTFQKVISLLGPADDPTKTYNNTRSDGGGVSKSAVPSIKVDYVFSDRNRISGLFSRFYTPAQYRPNAFPGVPPDGWPTDVWQRYMRFNHDFILRPNLLSHLTVGVNNRRLIEQPGAINRVPDDWRVATYLKGTTYGPVPGVSSRYTTEWMTIGSDVHTDSIQSTWNVNEQLAWIKGRHSVKFGFEFARPDYRRVDWNYVTGRVSFGSGATGNPGVSGQTGSTWASSLLGLSSGGSFWYGTDLDFYMPYFAWYVQDDFKVSSRLTLNLGFRYDLPFAKTEALRRTSSLNMTLPNPGAGGILGAMEFTGQGAGRNGKDRFYQTRFNALGPRIGVAYQISRKTVLRAGGAIYYQPTREDGNADNGTQGFGGGYSLAANYFGSGIALQLKDGFLPFASAIQANKPPRIDPTLQLYGAPFFWFPPTGRAPYFIDWQFTIEHNLTPNSLVRLTYHANRGIKLQSMQQSLNQLDSKYWAMYGTLLSRRVDDPAVVAAGFKLPYAGYPANRQLQQALRPFPQYDSIDINAGAMNDGHLTFNDFEATFEHRFSKGLYMLTAYTFSKLISNTDSELGAGTGAQDQYNRRLDKVVSADDRPHILSIAYVYDLPFGRGRAFLTEMPALANFVLGNWKISGIHRYTSGGAMGIGSGQNLFGAGRARASLAPGAGTTVPLVNPEWNSDPAVAWTVPYLNRAAFRRPNNMEYGNTPPRIAQLRGPKTINEDLAIMKNFRLKNEKQYFEFRASAFNVPNRHLLPGPDTNMDSANFGKIVNAQGNSARQIQLGLKFYF
jgi:hypothetical protein